MIEREDGTRNNGVDQTEQIIDPLVPGMIDGDIFHNIDWNPNLMDNVKGATKNK